MVLRVHERLLLLEMLRPEGSAAALRLRLRVMFREEEAKYIGLRQESGKWLWNTEIASDIDFLPTVRQQVYLSDLLEGLSEAGKLTLADLPLFDRFVLARE